MLDGLQSSLPAGVQIVYSYDTSPFVEESINQVYHTLIEAVVLVFLVILVFLQSWRATLIPTLAMAMWRPVQPCDAVNTARCASKARR